nr:hypothetical protein CFP56_54820 [Quercus suber]
MWVSFLTAAPMMSLPLREEKNPLESREDLARGDATQAAILTKPRQRKLQAMVAKASSDGGEGFRQGKSDHT